MLTRIDIAKDIVIIQVAGIELRVLLTLFSALTSTPDLINNSETSRLFFLIAEFKGANPF